MTQIASALLLGLFGWIAYSLNFRDPGLDVVTLIVGIITIFLFTHASEQKSDDASAMVRELSEKLQEMEQKKVEEKKKARVRLLG